MKAIITNVKKEIQKQADKKNAKKTAKKTEIRSNVNKGITKEGEKKSGIIQTILDEIKRKPQTQESLLKTLIKLFPDRDADGMKKTIKAQIGSITRPTRLEKERGIELKIEIKGDEQIVYSYVGIAQYDEEEEEEN